MTLISLTSSNRDTYSAAGWMCCSSSSSFTWNGISLLTRIESGSCRYITSGWLSKILPSHVVPDRELPEFDNHNSRMPLMSCRGLSTYTIILRFLKYQRGIQDRLQFHCETMLHSSLPCEPFIVTAADLADAPPAGLRISRPGHLSPSRASRGKQPV